MCVCKCATRACVFVCVCSVCIGLCECGLKDLQESTTTYVHAGEFDFVFFHIFAMQSSHFFLSTALDYNKGNKPFVSESFSVRSKNIYVTKPQRREKE
mmetsp:Transcript_98212/g.158350  ORF Transcript_98212/g.158350 Transcript_98212/m.158350 type:complete len:98 (+) Transcript_98212:19-312(+)